MEQTALRSPELLEITDGAGNIHYGCDQEWFGSSWQRMSGCGPCVASNIFLYLLRQKKLRLPYEITCKADFVRLMDAVWGFITPTQNGIYRSDQWAEGAEKFLRAHGSGFACLRLDIPSAKTKRPSFSRFVEFIKEGLVSDCPVAFLNLSNGKLKNLDAWHWVTIVSLQKGGNIHAGVYDAGAKLDIDLSLWYETTLLGGALVYLKQS